MSLKEYRTKRKFANTPEPLPKLKKKVKRPLLFCVQKHAARRLHYDFRLELDGVLISFAIPKMPSLDPKVKRLAVHVEDHPLEYINFAGEIPKGNYGAGTVEIWDEGTYEADEKKLREGIKSGHLRFFLNGQKLKGEFALIKIKDLENKNWLFFKLQKDSKNKLKMPEFISPMLATLTDKPFSSPQWIFEIKWDGYRAIARLDGEKVNLWSRNQKLINSDYPTIISALQKLNIRAILDGEIVVLDEKGISRFELLQDFKRNPNQNLYFMIFDLLFLDGEDLRPLPLIERKKKLKEILRDPPLSLVFSDHFLKSGVKLFYEAKKKGLEGLMAKHKDSTYVSDRSKDWLKIKITKQQEFIICGFTKGALLLGSYTDDELVYRGKVGTGFNTKNIKEIFKKLKPLIKIDSPFSKPPNIKNVTWVKPKILAEISFVEITKMGKLRHPVFHGLREVSSLRKHGSRQNAMKLDSRLRGNDNKPVNLEKVFWKKDNLKKKDLLAYYEVMAPFILPHLKGRPLTFIRFPDGIESLGFYQKNIDKPPLWLNTALVPHKHGQQEKFIQYALVEDKKSLLYFANLAAIEFHPMLARINNLDAPDFLVLDLDREELSFKKIIEVALAAHDLLEEIGGQSYCKTSGGMGLHIYVPLGGKINFEQSQNLAQLIAHSIKKLLPSLISLDRSPKKRKKKIYIDYLQNGLNKHVISPYSVRGRPHAPVSTPLKWEEVKDTLDPLDFNITSVPKRVLKIKDIFAPVLKNSINLKTILKRLEKFL